jgi:DNA mismatch repair protein MutS
LPDAVVARAEVVLGLLERDEQSGNLTRLADDLPLFTSAPARPLPEAGPSPIEAALAEVNPDELTPKTALELIYRLKTLSEEDA